MVFIVSVKADSVFKYEFFNEAAFERTHLTQNDVGKTFSDAHNPTISCLLTDQYSEVVKTRANVVFEDMHTSSRGEFCYSKTTLIPLSEEANDCAYIIGIVKDITRNT